MSTGQSTVVAFAAGFFLATAGAFALSSAAASRKKTVGGVHGNRFKGGGQQRKLSMSTIQENGEEEERMPRILRTFSEAANSVDSATTAATSRKDSFLSSEVLMLGEEMLSLDHVFHVAVLGKRVSLSNIAEEKVKKCYNYLQMKIAQGGTHYGINTGFGLLSSVRIDAKDLEQLQYNLIRSHACGVGKPISDSEARAMMLLRAHSLALGFSGVSVELIEHILAVLNAGIIPIIPEKGSVGASGDLCPSSHMSLVLIGEGRARFAAANGGSGEVMSGADALRLAGLTPYKLKPKEGLALINGTHFMTALGAIHVLEARFMCDLADVCAAISLEATRGSIKAYDALIQQVRPHQGQIKTAKHLRSLLLDSHDAQSEIANSHAHCTKVQDPYSFRCVPQVHGAVRDVVEFVRKTLETEMNSSTDNPLIFVEEDKILSGGNFHGEVIAMALDFLGIAVSELASISEQRFEKLLNPSLSELPAFLTSRGGLNSGFMIGQVTAAALVSANKTLAHPASVDSIATSADKEDHVSMGAWAAVKCGQIVDNSKKVLGLELLAACQGIDLLRERHGPLRSSPCIESIHAMVRERVPKIEQDRVFYEDIENIESLIRSLEFRYLLHDRLSTSSGLPIPKDSANVVDDDSLE